MPLSPYETASISSPYETASISSRGVPEVGCKSTSPGMLLHMRSERTRLLLDKQDRFHLLEQLKESINSLNQNESVTELKPNRPKAIPFLFVKNLKQKTKIIWSTTIEIETSAVMPSQKLESLLRRAQEKVLQLQF